MVYDQGAVGSNPGTGYWMDMINVEAFKILEHQQILIKN
jgi:hypothetical protein